MAMPCSLFVDIINPKRCTQITQALTDKINDNIINDIHYSLYTKGVLYNIQCIHNIISVTIESTLYFYDFDS